MRILITGASGFIGSAVVDAARQRGHDTLSTDLSRGGDIRDAAHVDQLVSAVDAVIHLAGVLGTHELFDTPHLAVDVNVNGTLNVLEACRNHGARYVGITMPQVFPSIYTATKVAATRLASAYHHTHGVPVSHVRAFNAFGPGQAHGPEHPQKIIPTFATCAWQGTPMPIWGDGTQTVDLIHTRDLARLLVDAIDHGDDVTFDGGSGQAFTVNEVAHMMSEIIGRDPLIEYLPMRRGETPTHIAATGEGWDRLDWRPAFRKADLLETVWSYHCQAAA